VYRFLARPSWVGFSVLMITIAVVMVGLGRWQLHRYQERTAINNRMDASAAAAPVPVGSVLAVGARPPANREWTRVSATGQYDTAHEIVVRGRTLDATVGFEILTPLVLPDGTALLVDRGWRPPTGGGATAAVSIPPAASGTVTVVGRVRLPESRAGTPVVSAGHLDVRRINPPSLAAYLPYPVYGGYVVLDSQQPPADPALRPIPADHENAWLNLGYVVQWWMFALLTLSGLVWAVRREAHREAEPADPALARAVPTDAALTHALLTDAAAVGAPNDFAPTGAGPTGAAPAGDMLTGPAARDAAATSAAPTDAPQSDARRGAPASGRRDRAAANARPTRPRDRVADSDERAARQAAAKSARE
jgi:cytochrome oxidase assembly protein ShyY1